MVDKHCCRAGGQQPKPLTSTGQTGMLGDPEGLEEGVTSSCACTLPGTVMENDGDILQGTGLHLCSGVGSGSPSSPVC